LARFGSKVLQRPTTSAYLRAAALEIADSSHRRRSALVVVRHCTSNLGYNWQNSAAAVGLVSSRVDTGADSVVNPPERKLLVLGNTPRMPSRSRVLCWRMGRLPEAPVESGLRTSLRSHEFVLDPPRILGPEPDTALHDAFFGGCCLPCPT
jgi:hypothetical protein